MEEFHARVGGWNSLARGPHLLGLRAGALWAMPQASSASCIQGRIRGRANTHDNFLCPPLSPDFERARRELFFLTGPEAGRIGCGVEEGRDR